MTITLTSFEEDSVFDNPAKKLTPIPWSTLIEDTISPFRIDLKLRPFEVHLEQYFDSSAKKFNLI